MYVVQTVLPNADVDFYMFGHRAWTGFEVVGLGNVDQAKRVFLRDSKRNAQQDESEDDALYKDCFKTKQI